MNEQWRSNPTIQSRFPTLGVALKCRGKLDEAITRYEQALAIQPNYPGVPLNLGNALREQGKLDQAVSRYEQALALERNSKDVLCNLGVARRDQGELSAAVAHYKQAIAIKPDYPEGLHPTLGWLSQSIPSWRRRSPASNDHRNQARYVQAYSNRAFCLNYHDRVTPAELFSAHCNWHERIARAVSSR